MIFPGKMSQIHKVKAAYFVPLKGMGALDFKGIRVMPKRNWLRPIQNKTLAQEKLSLGLS